MDVKLFDSERKVMEVLWKEGELPAGQLAKILAEEIGWNRNTTYTVIKKCVAKGAITRMEPNFICRPAITQQQAQAAETGELIDKVFEGSTEKFFAAFLSGRDFSSQELARLRQMIDEVK